jgi:hypothetical protein
MGEESMKHLLRILPVILMLLVLGSGCGKKEDYVPNPSDPPPKAGSLKDLKSLRGMPSKTKSVPRTDAQQQ